MKANILAILRQGDAPVSGERLSAELGISRVAVWKHIHQLQELAYDIEATSRGYRLVGGPDTPFPWVFGARSTRVHYFPEVASTMDAAMELAREGCPAFSVVVADRQTKGRGRLAREWRSADGGLYFTMVLRPRLALDLSPLVNLAAAVALAAAVEDLYAVRCELKWPNDVLVQERKLAGILSQMSVEADQIEFINLGIGVNVRNDTRHIEAPAVAVAELTDRSVSRADILSAFWDRLEDRLTQDALPGVIDEWKRQAVTLGRQVRVQTINDHIDGRAVDVDETGGLVVEIAPGTYRTVIYGDCFHQDGNRAGEVGHRER